ncbi:MAG: tetratricopeptide repeat protein [Promethearchaeota archaeon]|jgi:tetratricopeptide (TPR) repeat protein
MEELQNFKDYLLHKNKITFLVGAGISMDAPSNLPSAQGFSQTLLKYITPIEEFEKISSLEGLRYEMVIERVQNGYDENLWFMDYLDLIEKYNKIHLFLAHSIKMGKNVITTNFDYLIEHALMDLLDENERNLIIPIITKEDFEKSEDRDYLRGKYPLFKIHGSKKNIITDEITIQSLITTISSLGKDREATETFSIEKYKEPLMSGLLKNAVLIVMGYSGSDTFDVTPLLKKFPDLEAIIWIDHSLGDSIEISDISKHKKPIEKLTNLENLLTDLHLQHGYDVYYIKSNTRSFIEKILWTTFLSNLEIPKIKEFSSPIMSFEEFIEPEYKNFSLTQRYNTAVKIYTDLSQYDDAMRCAEIGIPIADRENEIQRKANFLNHIGIIKMNQGDIDGAIESYERALEINKKCDYKFGIANVLNSLGMCHRRRSEHTKAIEYYKESIKYYEEIESMQGLMIEFNNLGVIFAELNESKKALEYYEKSLEYAGILGDLTRKATRLNNIATLYDKEFDDAPKAISYTLDALKIYEEMGEYASQAIAYNNLAIYYDKSGNTEETIKAYRKSIEIALDSNNIISLSQSYPNLADFYFDSGNLDKAIQYMNLSIEVDNKIGDKKGQANKIYRLGRFFHQSEDFINAEIKYLESIEISKNVDNFEDLNEAAFWLAEIYFNNENYAKAIIYYKMGLECANKLGISSDIAIYNQNLGYSYERQEDFETAIKYYGIAQNLYERNGDSEKNFEMIENISWALNDLGKIDSAITRLEDYIISLENSNLIETMDKALETIITMCIMGNELDRGTKYAEKRLHIAIKNSDQRALAYTYSSLAIINDKLGEIATAITFSEKAIEYAKKIEDKDLINTHTQNIEIFRRKLNIN